jgi:hypothetical protein
MPWRQATNVLERTKFVLAAEVLASRIWTATTAWRRWRLSRIPETVPQMSCDCMRRGGKVDLES